MRTTLLLLACLLSGILTAQTIHHPTFKARTGSISNITRIERTPEATKLYIHAIFRPHWWIMESGDSYLVDTAGGAKYPFVKAEGIELKEKTFMPDSGEMDYVLHFAPLPKTTTTIHLLSPTDPEGNTYDISLVPASKKEKNPLASLKGNWYDAGNSRHWLYGIYDSICIFNNRIYTRTNLRQKGKRIELTLKDTQNGEAATLLLLPQKDGNLVVDLNGENQQTCTRRQATEAAVGTEADFTQFFRKDTAHLQGYINGYDPRLGFETGLVYLQNALTREDSPTVINIHPDGRLEGKLPLNHAVQSALLINNQWIPFYIEPGQTLTLYIDWEAILARNRARNRDLPIENIEYMGPSAALSHLNRSLDQQFNYSYDKLSKAQQELTPAQFKESMQPIFAQWNHTGDSLTQVYAPSAKAVHMLKNRLALKKGSILFDFLMSRSYYARQDSTNQVLKVQEDDSYYHFLKDLPLNDPTLLADNIGDTFINRFEFMNPFFRNLQLPDSLIISYPSKTMLTFLKEKGVKLNADQEKLRIEEEALAGKKIKKSMKDLQKKNPIISQLLQKEKELLDEYNKLYFENSPKLTDEEQDNQYFGNSRSEFARKDSIVHALTGQANSFIWQSSLVRRLDFELSSYKTREWAAAHVDALTKHLTHPVLTTEAQRLLSKIHPKNASLKSYRLPEGKATDIFSNIIRAHAGKMLYVDFWATTCGPCRGNIEASAPLRQQYKDHPEFQFIFITGERESPQADYDAYVEKNLKGEACYRVSDTEFNYLRQLFKFNGIPHHEWVEKDGSIANQCPKSWKLKEYLNQRLGKADK